MFANNENNLQTIGTREDIGKAIAEKSGQIIRMNDHSYKVKSQSGDILYDVTSTQIGWRCSCPDHQTRGVQCKHIFGVVFSFGIRKEVEKVRIEPIVSVSSCVYCHSTNVIKYGIRHNKYGDVQLFHCNECSRHYTRLWDYNNSTNKFYVWYIIQQTSPSILILTSMRACALPIEFFTELVNGFLFCFFFEPKYNNFTIHYG